MVKKEVKTIAILGVLALLVIPLASAGIFDWFKEKVQGAPVDLNLTIAASNPLYIYVWNNTMTDDTSSGIAWGPNEGPDSTYVTVVFTACDPDGYTYIQQDSGIVNFSYPGEVTRENNTCHYDGYTEYPGEDSNKCVNFTCEVEMYWYDGPGGSNWNIGAYARDEGNFAINETTTFFIGESDLDRINVNNITGWPTLASGDFNITPTGDPVIFNNTGNKDDKTFIINATDLVGEVNNLKRIIGSNFSAGDATSGGDMVNQVAALECGDTTSTRLETEDEVQLVGVVLPKGDYTTETVGSDIGRQDLYFCLRLAGNPGELDAQPYSTFANPVGSWEIYTQ